MVRIRATEEEAVQVTKETHTVMTIDTAMIVISTIMEIETDTAILMITVEVDDMVTREIGMKVDVMETQEIGQILATVVARTIMIQNRIRDPLSLISIWELQNKMMTKIGVPDQDQDRDRLLELKQQWTQINPILLRTTIISRTKNIGAIKDRLPQKPSLRLRNPMRSEVNIKLNRNISKNTWSRSTTKKVRCHHPAQVQDSKDHKQTIIIEEATILMETMIVMLKRKKTTETIRRRKEEMILGRDLVEINSVTTQLAVTLIMMEILRRISLNLQSRLTSLVWEVVRKNLSRTLTTTSVVDLILILEHKQLLKTLLNLHRHRQLHLILMPFRLSEKVPTQISLETRQALKLITIKTMEVI